MGSCAFARRYLRNHCYFLFLRVLRCFSSPRSPGRQKRPCHGHAVTGFPIRTSAGHRAFAPHRGFSQLVTSFFASESHRHPPCALYTFSCSYRQRPTRLPLRGAEAPSSYNAVLYIHTERALAQLRLILDLPPHALRRRGRSILRRFLRYSSETSFSKKKSLSSCSQHVNDLCRLRSPRQT